MSKRDNNLYIDDILDSIQQIEEYTKGIDKNILIKDRKTVDAVVRNISIIGEAVNNISEEIKFKYPQIPWREIADMRNKTIHEYFGIDLDILWETIKRDLPILKTQILEILEKNS